MAVSLPSYEFISHPSSSPKSLPTCPLKPNINHQQNPLYLSIINLTWLPHNRHPEYGIHSSPQTINPLPLLVPMIDRHGAFSTPSRINFLTHYSLSALFLSLFWVISTPTWWSFNPFELTPSTDLVFHLSQPPCHYQKSNSLLSSVSSVPLPDHRLWFSNIPIPTLTSHFLLHSLHIFNILFM